MIWRVKIGNNLVRFLKIAMCVFILAFAIAAWGEEDSDNDIDSTRYEAYLALMRPDENDSFEGAWTGRCLMKWTSKQATGVMYLSYSYGESAKQLKIRIGADNSEDGTLRIQSSDGPLKLSAVLRKTVEPEAGVSYLRWTGWLEGADVLFSTKQASNLKPYLVLTRALTRGRNPVHKTPPKPTADSLAFQYVGDGGAVAGWLELMVRSGKEREAKRLLDENHLKWRIQRDDQPWYWRAEVPNFSEGFWAKKLYDSGLFDNVVREGAGAGPGDQIMFYCQTKRVFSVDPWKNFEQAQLDSRAFFKKIVMQAFGGKRNVTIDWLAVSKPHTYRAIVRGPSTTIGRGSTGLWEEHQFEVEFSDVAGFQPRDKRKTTGRKEYIVVTVNQITCKTAHGPIDRPPPNERYSHDDSQESIAFLRKFGDSFMENEKAVVENPGFLGLFENEQAPADNQQ
jgi:hypothetical protein